MPETGPDLRFDKATYATPDGPKPAGVPCGNCAKPIGEQYWTWQRHMVCARCRDVLSATLAGSQSMSAFGKAAIQGGGAALACGAAYATFVALTHIQIAVATIGIAVVIAKVVRSASRGVSGRRFQILAVALTYLASTMGYVPGIFSALKSSDAHHAATTAPAASGQTPPAATASDLDVSPASSTLSRTSSSESTAQSEGTKRSVGPFDVLIAVGLLLGLTLAAPFLELTEAPLGALIIAIGLWQAWKLSRGVPTQIDGPFRSASQAAPAA